MNAPRWIVFEGIDGSGKTTQAKLLDEYLRRNGVKSRYRHVFDTEAGMLLRELFISNSFSNTVEILLLSAARQAFLDELSAEESDYDVLLVDRFFLSILAMQGRDKEDVELINYIRRNICSGRDRSFVFHMSTPPEECKRRLDQKRALDRIELKGVEFHRAVAERYMAALRIEDAVHHFDGAGDIETVHEAVVEKAALLLGVTVHTNG